MSSLTEFSLACSSEGAPFGFMPSGKPRKRPTVGQAKQLEKHGVDWKSLDPNAKPPRRQTEEHKEKAMINLDKARVRSEMIRQKKIELLVKTYGPDWAKSHSLKELTSQEALTGEVLPRMVVDTSKIEKEEPPHIPPTVRAAARLSEAKKVPSIGALVDIVGNLIADVRESRNAADEVKELVKTEAAERAQRKAEKAARLQAEKAAKEKLEADAREAAESKNKLKIEEDERQKIQIIKEQEQQHKKIIKNGKIW